MGMGLLPRRPLLTSFWTSGGLWSPDDVTGRAYCHRDRLGMAGWIAYTHRMEPALRLDLSSTLTFALFSLLATPAAYVRAPDSSWGPIEQNSTICVDTC